MSDWHPETAPKNGTRILLLTADEADRLAQGCSCWRDGKGCDGRAGRSGMMDIAKMTDIAKMAQAIDPEAFSQEMMAMAQQLGQRELLLDRQARAREAAERAIEASGYRTALQRIAAGTDAAASIAREALNG